MTRHAAAKPGGGGGDGGGGDGSGLSKKARAEKKRAEAAAAAASNTKGKPLSGAALAADWARPCYKFRKQTLALVKVFGPPSTSLVLLVALCKCTP